MSEWFISYSMERNRIPFDFVGFDNLITKKNPAIYYKSIESELMREVGHQDVIIKIIFFHTIIRHKRYYKCSQCKNKKFITEKGLKLHINKMHDF